jgi:hypothetical protein
MISKVEYEVDMATWDDSSLAEGEGQPIRLHGPVALDERCQNLIGLKFMVV